MHYECCYLAYPLNFKERDGCVIFMVPIILSKMVLKWTLYPWKQIIAKRAYIRKDSRVEEVF